MIIISDCKLAQTPDRRFMLTSLDSGSDSEWDIVLPHLFCLKTSESVEASVPPPPYFSSQMRISTLLLGRRVNKSSKLAKTADEYDALKSQEIAFPRF